MFTKISHTDGITTDREILFSTSFNYFFPDAARSRQCLLAENETTLNGLKALGQLMADPGEIGDPQTVFDADTPAIFTYFGQFIDHDITARTDRDGTLSVLGRGESPVPLDPDEIVARIHNGRRAQLDLDSVFGEGPGLSGSVLPATTQSNILYDEDYKLSVFSSGNRFDVPRVTGTHEAIVADMRNDENIMISQIQAAFLNFFNAVHAVQSGSNKEKYIRARQLVRWAYQFVVVNDYLMRVCDEYVVQDTLANGPRFIGPTAGKGDAFMPLEFSVAAFRFGHSMIRPFYRLNASSGEVPILALLGPSEKATNFDAADGQLGTHRVIDWSNFAGTGAAVQKARKIDTRIAKGLFTLPLGDRASDPVLSHLARSNLLRGYSMSIPTGQAICDAFGILPLSAADIHNGEDPDIVELLEACYFDHRTPLWYYVLRESAVQHEGERLGEVGSRLVAETIIGLLKQDPNSYLNNSADRAVKVNSVDVKPGAGGDIRTLTDILNFAGVASL